MGVALDLQLLTARCPGPALTRCDPRPFRTPVCRQNMDTFGAVGIRHADSSYGFHAQGRGGGGGGGQQRAGGGGGYNRR
jgi:hypothetical protein